MHILYIHQYFTTPKGSTGTRSYEFARRWIKAGHKVTLITGHHDLSGLEPGRGLIQKQTVEGINIVVVGVKYSNKQSFPRRIISFLLFCLFCIYAGLRIKKVNVMYVTSTPLTVGIPAIVLKYLKRIPFVFEVRDHWPAALVELGIINNKLLIKILSWFEKLIYKKSAAIITVSDGMAEGIRQVAGETKPIYVIPNGADLDFFRPDIDGSAIRKEKRWDDKLVLVYAGALGMTNGSEFIADAAEKLMHHQDILFVLIGKGIRKDALEKRIEQTGLKNIEIQPLVPKQQLPAILAAADVIMSIIANFAIIERYASLNKFYDGLSSGKPILLNYSGWHRDILERNKAGCGCKLGDVDEFVEKVLYLNSHRQELLEMGKNARRIAEKQFNRDKLATQALDIILSAVA
ncbi:MAG: glycosyltransferase family 4 protein [Phycisphaerae bacterium]|nr:glycosyltransferase family 4 protein [Phycisphaerae bacterium]